MFNPQREEFVDWRGSDVLRSRNEPYALISSQRPSASDYELSFHVSIVIVRVHCTISQLSSTMAPVGGREYDLFELLLNQLDSTAINELPQLISELESYANLPENWDLEGAQKPRERAVSDALTFLETFPENISLPYPEVGRDGDVGIYWDNHESHTFAQIVFEGDGCFTYIAIVNRPDCARESCGEEGLALDSGWPHDLLQVLRSG